MAVRRVKHNVSTASLRSDEEFRYDTLGSRSHVSWRLFYSLFVMTIAPFYEASVALFALDHNFYRFMFLLGLRPASMSVSSRRYFSFYTKM